MIGGGRPLLRENLADTDPHACKKPIFKYIFSPAAPQPEHLEKNSININMLSNKPKMNIVRCP